jgi:thiamine phosphate synthase YjbQ (UPF0047 family)
MKVVYTRSSLYALKVAQDSPAEQYRRKDTGEDNANANAHLKPQIMGREVVGLAIINGEMDFRPWEQIFYGQFDGQRNKSTGEGDWRVWIDYPPEKEDENQ